MPATNSSGGDANGDTSRWQATRDPNINLQPPTEPFVPIAVEHSFANHCLFATNAKWLTESICQVPMCFITWSVSDPLPDSNCLMGIASPIVDDTARALRPI